MYARTVEGKVLTFGVSGKLVRNSLIMYDRETHSLWSHLTGAAIEGPLKGTQLQVITATQTTWREWRRAYPSTLVLKHDYPGQRDSYRSYYAGGDSGILGRKRDNTQLPAKAKVLGLRIQDHPKAYAIDSVLKAGAVNDTLENVPLVVFGAGDGAAAFRRDVTGQTLTFRKRGDGSIADQETGSRWDPVSGRAVDGSLAGTSLVQLPATNSFWFGWFDFFPGTELYK